LTSTGDLIYFQISTILRFIVNLLLVSGHDDNLLTQQG